MDSDVPIAPNSIEEIQHIMNQIKHTADVTYGIDEQYQADRDARGIELGTKLKASMRGYCAIMRIERPLYPDGITPELKAVRRQYTATLKNCLGVVGKGPEHRAKLHGPIFGGFSNPVLAIAEQKRKAKLRDGDGAGDKKKRLTGAQKRRIKEQAASTTTNNQSPWVKWLQEQRRNGVIV